MAEIVEQQLPFNNKGIIWTILLLTPTCQLFVINFSHIPLKSGLDQRHLPVSHFGVVRVLV